MPIAQVLQKDVDELLQSGKLSVHGRHPWEPGAHKLWCRAEVPVLIDDPGIKNVSLRIVISVSAATQKYDFALLWNGMRIRALCINGSHTNRHTDTQKWLRQMHKHTWTDRCMDRFAYTPTDITAGDVHGQFAQFCSECGIACAAELAEVPVPQGELFDEL